MTVETTADVSVAGERRGLTTPRRLTLVAMALIVGQLVVRAVGTTGGYFTSDDFKFLRMASTSSLTPDFLMQFYNGHLMPGGLLYVWVHQALAPGSYPAAVAAMLLVQGLASLAMWRLLTQLFGHRWAVVVLMAWWCFTVMTLDSALWWAAAINSLPVQFLGILGALCVVRMVRRPSRVAAAGAVLCFILALAFFEKAVLLGPIFLMLACAVAAPRSRSDLWRMVVRRYLGMWVTLVVITLVYLAYYRANVQVFDLHQSASDVFQVAFGGYGYAIVPALVGGPWTWFAIGGIGAAARPPDWAALLALNVVVLLVVASVWLRRLAAYAWAFLAAYVLVDIAAVCVGRLVESWTFIGQIYRYSADAAPVAVVVLGYAFLPLVGERDAYTTTGRKVARWLGAHRGARAALAIASVNVIVLSSLMSTQFPLAQWQSNPARAYFANVRADLGTLPDGATFLPQGVPPTVMEPLFGPWASTESMLSPLPNSPTFALSAEDPWMVRDDGHLVPAVVSTFISADFGPAQGCGWPITAAGGTIRLRGPAVPWVYASRINYLASADGTADVRLGDGRPVRLTFQKGAHEVSVQLEGGGSTIGVSALSPGLALCVGGAVLGNLEPAPGFERP